VPAYGSLGYRFTPRLEGAFRYDFLNVDRDATGDTTVRDLIFGLNYYIKGNNAKVQANLIRRNGAKDLSGTVANPATDIHNDRTELRIQGQVAF
jgi:phosphate-selective porin